MGQGDSRRPVAEGRVKGEPADSPAHLLNDTDGTTEDLEPGVVKTEMTEKAL